MHTVAKADTVRRFGLPHSDEFLDLGIRLFTMATQGISDEIRIYSPQDLQLSAE